MITEFCLLILIKKKKYENYIWAFVLFIFKRKKRAEINQKKAQNKKKNRNFS